MLPIIVKQKQNSAPATPKHERGAETRCTAARDDDIVNISHSLFSPRELPLTRNPFRIVAEYSLYAAVGRMDAQTLGLSVPYYDPLEHYDVVKNKWFGLRPPSPPAPDE